MAAGARNRKRPCIDWVEADRVDEAHNDLLLRVIIPGKSSRQAVRRTVRACPVRESAR